MAEEKILDIKVNYEDAIKKIAEYRMKLEDVKNTEAALKKQLKDGIIDRETYNETISATKIAMDSYKRTIQDVEKQVKNQIKADKEQEGSLASLRAKLSIATAEYDKMGEAERESAKGQALKNHINEITDVLKTGEEATQRYYRNVGNYENSVSNVLSGLQNKIKEAKDEYIKLVETEGAQAKATEEAKKKLDDLQLSFDFTEQSAKGLNESVLGFVTAGNPWAMTASKMVSQLGSVKNAFNTAKIGAQMLGKQLLVLMANPIVAFLALVAVGISALVKGIKSSEDNTNRLKVAFSAFAPVLDWISNLFTGLASIILTVVEGAGQLIGWLSKLAESIPVVGDAIAEGNKKIQERVDLQKSQIEYEKAVRDEIVKSAERENEISELRAKVTDKENYTAKERKEALEAAIKLEREQADERKRLAEMNLANLEKEASLTENDAEMNNKLAEAKAAVIRADTDYNNKIREMNAQRSELNNQITAEEKAKQDERAKAAEDAAKRIIEAKQKELDEIRRAEDELLKLITDSLEQRRKQTELTYERQMEDLQRRLDSEVNLTKAAKDAIVQQMNALSAGYIEAMHKLDNEELKKNISDRQTIIANQLEAVKAGSDAEYQLKLEQLQLQQEAELANTEMTEELKESIIAKYGAKRAELEKENQDNITAQQQEAIRIRFETELLQLGDNELGKLELIAEQKRMELETMQQMEGESLEAFNLRKLQKEEEFAASKKAITDKENEIEQTKLEAAATVTNGIVGLMDTLGQQSKAAAKVAKIVALGEILINQGKAVAAGIAQAQSVPFPANIAAIATTIANILAGITSAISTVKSAKFADGGAVVGPGTGTSDSIHARLSNGESVLTARATSMFAPLISAMNQMGGGVPINVQSSSESMGEEMLARAVARGVENISPVVSVEEINRVTHRVRVVENAGSL